MTLEDILSVLSTVGNVLDTPRAMTWEGLRGGNPFDVANPFDEEAVAQRPTGWDVMKGLGFEGREGLDWTDVPAVAMEVVADPLNLVGGGVLAKLFGKAGKAKKVAKEAVASNVKREKLLGIGAMPEEIAAKTTIRSSPEATAPAARKAIGEYIGGTLEDTPRLLSNTEMAERTNTHQLLRDAIRYDPKLRGEPARVFHGTTEAFDQFGKTKDFGYHFGDPMQANTRLEALAGESADMLPGSNVRMQYLDVRRPAYIEDPGNWAQRPGLAEDLRAQGFDAAWYDNAYEGGGPSVAVLDPAQIYAPYIAPTLREVPQIPRTWNSPLMTAMLGYNAARPMKEF